MAGGDTGGAQYFALLFLTFVLIVAHAGGTDPTESGLFRGGYELIKVPFDVLGTLLHGMDAGWAGIIALLTFSLVIMPGLGKYVGADLLEFSVLAAVIAIATGTWAL